MGRRTSRKTWLAKGDEIRRLREGKNWSRAQLARWLGCSEGWIEKIEHLKGRALEEPLRALAAKLDVPFEKIVVTPENEAAYLAARGNPSIENDVVLDDDPADSPNIAGVQPPSGDETTVQVMQKERRLRFTWKGKDASKAQAILESVLRRHNPQSAEIEIIETEQ